MMVCRPTLRCAAAALVVLAAGAAFVWWGLPKLVPPASPAKGGAAKPPTASSTATESVSPEPLEPPAEFLHLAAAHGRPESNAIFDLRQTEALLEAWVTNFPSRGLPVGDNRDITRALLGANPLRIAFIDRSHPSLSRTGEWCDRWGTPYRFHALGAGRMEVASAGPDRRFGTEDDVGAFTPAP